MENDLIQAIDNNVAICAAVVASQGIQSIERADIWYSLESAPPFYPNIITRSPLWTPDDTLLQIRAKFKGSTDRAWSIKDSFALLDLVSLGFSKLFNASWFRIQASAFAPHAVQDLQYTVISDKQGLDHWRLAWGKNEQLGKSIFGTSLLENPDFHFIAGYSGSRIVSGCIFNRSHGTYGISNVFYEGDSLPRWSGLISFFFEIAGRVDIAGYEKDILTSMLAPIGCERLGPLTVWLSNRTAPEASLSLVQVPLKYGNIF